MINRRKFLGAMATTSTVALAGCSKILQQEAKPARFDPVTVNESDYSLKDANKVSSESILKQVNPDLNKNISVDGYIVSYYHNELPQSITAISTPSLSTFGRELNPIMNSDTEKTLKLFAGRIREDGSELSIESIEPKDEREIETSEGTKTLEVFDVEMSSSDWGEVYFDFLVIKYKFDDSVVLTAATVLREITSLPIDYAVAYEEEVDRAEEVLAQVDYPVDWVDITTTVESEE